MAGATPPQQLPTITITLNPATGALQVGSNVIGQRVVCFGMLEMARDAIRQACDEYDKNGAAGIAVPGPLFIPGR